MEFVAYLNIPQVDIRSKTAYKLTVCLIIWGTSNSRGQNLHSERYFKQFDFNSANFPCKLKQTLVRPAGLNFPTENRCQTLETKPGGIR